MTRDEDERSRAFVDRVMRQIATRPLPRRSWWLRFVAPREVTVTVRFRPAAWAAGAAAVALLAVVVARPHRGATTVAVGQPALAPAGDGQDTVAQSATANAPVVVRFALSAPNARAVGLAGDFNGWRADATPLVRGADGVWSAEVPLSHGNWSYSFVVDGKWVEDPLAESWRADGFGGRNAVVRVGDSADRVGAARGG
jgi:hypothetical protein